MKQLFRLCNVLQTAFEVILYQRSTTKADAGSANASIDPDAKTDSSGRVSHLVSLPRLERTRGLPRRRAARQSFDHPKTLSVESVMMRRTRAASGFKQPQRVRETSSTAAEHCEPPSIDFPCQDGVSGQTRGISVGMATNGWLFSSAERVRVPSAPPLGIPACQGVPSSSDSRALGAVGGELSVGSLLYLGVQSRFNHGHCGSGWGVTDPTMKRGTPSATGQRRRRPGRC
ncbi:MAG: hypothetical protein BMS9Abin17_1330 [Acidimicrobiia bacterium]|nr:MAG: hypothetical protein BMS9Abin17_1330 [Acidimicrobiia bacterium]